MLYANICWAEQYIALPSDQEQFFYEQIESVELFLEIDEKIDAISPAIGQLTKLQMLYLLGASSDDEWYAHNVTIPLELLNLPNLHTFVIDGMNLFLPSDVEASQVQSHIETMRISNWGSEGAPVLACLTQLRQLYIKIGTTYPKIRSEKTAPGGIEVKEADLSLFLNQLPELRKLHIWGWETLLLDESLCALTNLEELTLETAYSPLPDCLVRLTRLQSVKMSICASESKSYQIAKDPIMILASLPNLEFLILWGDPPILPIVMPDVTHGFNKLRELYVGEFPEPRGQLVFGMCPSKPMFPIMNFDNIIDYPNLETFGFMPEIIQSVRPKFICSFVETVDANWKEGNLLRLERIWGYGYQVWQRPASIEISGITLPGYLVQSCYNPVQHIYKESGNFRSGQNCKGGCAD